MGRVLKKKDINRLMTALIINEQNKIQKPVIENAYFQKHVFAICTVQISRNISC